MKEKRRRQSLEILLAGGMSKRRTWVEPLSFVDGAPDEWNERMVPLLTHLEGYEEGGPIQKMTKGDYEFCREASCRGQR